MKVSTKGRYGLRAIVDLAVYGGNEHVSLYSVADRQKISTSYLEQVFSTLRKSGLVVSVKGSQGGYKLSKKPEFITVKEVIEVLEGDLLIVDTSEAVEPNDFVKKAINEVVWDSLNYSLDSLFQSVTIEKLADDYRNSKGMNPVMYYI